MSLTPAWNHVINIEERKNFSSLKFVHLVEPSMAHEKIFRDLFEEIHETFFVNVMNHKKLRRQYKHKKELGLRNTGQNKIIHD